jgi:cyclopropane-fatty-acyl-phospholipid synthase
MNFDTAIDSGLVPDWAMERIIPLLLKRDLRGGSMSPAEREAYLEAFIADLDSQPVAVRTDDSRRQHYEVPPEFFAAVLGSALKYSCCLWPDFGTDWRDEAALDRAEEAMLSLTEERADIRDGMRVLELGCGWGSLSLHLASRFPRCAVTAVSHSASQKAWIDAAAAARGLGNLEVVTADMNDFRAAPGTYDRIVSVEMFEHMRNWRLLLGRAADWLKRDGAFFLHVFTVQDLPYLYDAEDPDQWMARNFFAGGMMPYPDLPSRVADRLREDARWTVDGRHYALTLRAWLARMDRRGKAIMPVLERTYGADAARWRRRWRLFFLSCAVVFGYRGGSTWNVTQYRFVRAD